MLMPTLDKETISSADQKPAEAKPWNVRLHNDPVSTTEYVTYTLMQVLNKPREVCEKYMLEAHETGSAVVYTGPKEKAETIATQLLSFLLQVTVEQQS